MPKGYPTMRALRMSREREWLRQQHIANEPAYFAYLDALYARYGLTDPRKAVLAELVPLLGLTERTKLAKFMRNAGYEWPGLTGQY